jgi:hypothetical protein
MYASDRDMVQEREARTLQLFPGVDKTPRAFVQPHAKVPPVVQSDVET